MSWKRHFRIIRNNPQAVPNPLDANRYGGGSGTSANYSSFLPLVYAGHPQRIPRYFQFDDMDRDSDINAALDTIADFCTQSEEQTEEPFVLQYHGDPNESEVKILKTMLDKWIKLNNFTSRLWYMFRDTLKNGDAFYLRDPETQEWLWLDHFMVEMVKVDETDGKRPDEYLIRGMDYNKQVKFATKKADPNQYRTPYGTSNVGIGAARVAPVSSASAPASFSLAGTAIDPRQRHMMGPFAQDVQVIDANYVVHLSLSIGNDINWPFGASILEPIFKVFKQKELLEDAIIIYRVQRAPERRIFYIDTGTMPPERAKRHIEAIKNDIHQRRIPNRTGTGGCFDMATRVPLLDGRTLSIAELASEHGAGKQNWTYSCDPHTGEIVPGKITWAGTTRRDAEVVRLTLDNGQTIVCTPEHKFPVFGRGKTEAKDIAVGFDSLISFNTRLFSINEWNDPRSHYHQVYDHALREWRYTHRIVAHFMKQIDRHNEMGPRTKKTVIHHGDFNRYNNNPENLFFMNGQDHFDLHARMTPELMERMTPEEHLALSLKKSKGGAARWARDRKKNPQRIENARTRFIANTHEQQQKPWANQANVWDRELFDILVTTLKANGGGKRETAAQLSANDKFMALYRDLNKPTDAIIHLNFEKFSVTTLEKLIKVFGFTGWRELLHDCGYEVRKPTLGIKTNHSLLSMIVSKVQGMDDARLPEVCKALSADADFMALYSSLNQDTLGMSNKDKISINTMKSIIAKHGYKTWTSFRQNLSCFNHKVIAIEYLTETMDVGTLTIDGSEEYHGHHTFALEQGVFVFNSILDAAYNPLSINDDYFFAMSADGRGSKVETLPGGELTGEVGDLMFFSRKLARGLRIPVSYLNLGEDDGNAAVMFNDGKLGAAMIQEFRFSKFCMRLQSLLSPVFDKEFKRFLIKNGIEMEWSLFQLQFSPPQSFTRYRQIELDSQRVQVYSGVAENRILAQRFKLQRYLGLTEDEIIENEKMWAEENAAKLKKKMGASPAETDTTAGLGDIGIHPGGDVPLDIPPEEQIPPEEGGGVGMAPGGGAGAGAGGAMPAAGGGAGAMGAGAAPPMGA